jgi:hypothetical protein
MEVDISMSINEVMSDEWIALLDGNSQWRMTELDEQFDRVSRRENEEESDSQHLGY